MVGNWPMAGCYFELCTNLRFLEIAFVREVGMYVCVCVSAPEAINNYSCEMNP